jgi:hypothetical protein
MHRYNVLCHQNSNPSADQCRALHLKTRSLEKNQHVELIENRCVVRSQLVVCIAAPDTVTVLASFQFIDGFSKIRFSLALRPYTPSFEDDEIDGA